MVRNRTDRRVAGCLALGVVLVPLASPEKEDAVPYEKVSDLPEAQVDQYTEHQKHAFLKAFNNALEEYDGDESRAFATAHAAAQQAPEEEPAESRR
jgi:cation transport regulator